MMAGTNTPVSRKYLHRWLMRHWCLAFVALSLTYIYYYCIQERAPGPVACLHLQDARSVSQTGFYIIVLRRQSLQYFLYRALPKLLRARISNLNLN